MEAFTVQCTTCQSKLRVRDPNLLHQIVNCPKCNSLLQIEPPTRISVQPPGQGSVDSTAMTREAISPDVAPLLNQHAAEHPSHDHETSAQGGSFDWSDDEFRLAPLEAETSTTADVPLNWQSPEVPPLNPNEEWTSPRAAQSKQYLLISFIGLGGFIIAGILFFLFLRWIDNSDAPVVADAGDSPVAAVPNPADQSPPENEPAENDPPVDEPQEPTAADGSSTEQSSNDRTTIEEPSIDAQEPALPIESDTADGDPIAQQPAPTPSDDDDLASDSSDLNGFDALPDDTQTPEAGAELPKQLQAIQKLLDYQIVPTLTDTMVLPSEAPVTAEEMGLDASANSTPAAPAIDVAERAKALVPGLIVKDRSLSSLVNMWTHLSGVPTNVDLDALAAAGIDRHKLINVQQRDAKPAKVVGQSIAATMDCELVELDNSAWLMQPTLDAIRKHLPSSVNIDALIKDDASRAWLETAVAELVPELQGKTTWQDKELQFANADRANREEWLAWFRLLRLLNAWQLAATGSSSPNLDPQFFQQTMVDPGQIPALTTTMDFVVAETLPSGQLLSRCADRAGIQCFVDWASVGEAGLSPSSRFVSVTKSREFRRILADYAAEYSCVVAVLDDKTLWLTTPTTYRMTPRLYVMPSNGRSEDQWRQELRLLTPISADGNSQLRILPTPDNQWILVRCCSPQLQF